MKLNKCQDAPFKGKDIEKENYDIYNCLELFTKEEVLDKDNEWYKLDFF